jgi:hypothetical protein
LVVLLLSRFAPITESEDADNILAMLRAAWDSVGIVDEKLVAVLVARVDCRGLGFEWRRTASLGWTIHQDDRDHLRGHLYTMRKSENEAFPFKEFQVLVEEARKMCR